MTSAKTRWLGVLGWPIEHSRSPAIHTAALEASGIDAVYLPLPVPPASLASAVDGLRALGALGANVTLPHKERVMEHLDAVEPSARAIGAVNTIVRDGDRLVGANTDGAGLARSLHEAGVTLAGARVLVVGAGGAARASVAGLLEAGAGRVAVAARRVERAAEIASSIEGAVSALDLGDPEAMRDAAAQTDLLVQATSATLGERDPAFAASLPLAALPASAAVVDLVYSPRATSVLRAAAARGLRTVDGLGMLVWQAALAFERWHGVTAPVEVMRRAAERAV